LPPSRNKAAPFIKLVIPEPFEVLNDVQVRHAPADADPPAKSPVLPGRPVLPAK
jgi:hypothetical protein